MRRHSSRIDFSMGGALSRLLSSLACLGVVWRLAWATLRYLPTILPGQPEYLRTLLPLSMSDEDEEASPPQRTTSRGYKRRGQRELEEEANALGIATRRADGDVDGSPQPWAAGVTPARLEAPPGKVAFYVAAVAPMLTCTLCNQLLRDVRVPATLPAPRPDHRD